MTAPLYQLEGVGRRFAMAAGDVEALRAIDLLVEQGELLALAGPSGSGKTTLLNLIGLIDAPSAGRLTFLGQDTTRSSQHALTELRREHIAFVFQSLNLVPVLTALENVEYFMLRQSMPAAEVRSRARTALERVGMLRFADHPVPKLSGGQQQRVAIARAVARKPRVILADEPTAALDHATGSEIVALLGELNREQGVTVVYSSHDPKVLQAARRVVQLEDGRVISAPSSR